MGEIALCALGLSSVNSSEYVNIIFRTHHAHAHAHAAPRGPHRHARRTATRATPIHLIHAPCDSSLEPYALNLNHNPGLYRIKLQRQPNATIISIG